MQIDAYYDILCPFSYLAKRYLERSIARFPDVPVAITLKPFMLHPTLPIAGPHSFRSAFTDKYGEGARVPMWDRVIALGAEVGIAFAFYRIEQGAHAIHGHRAVRFAERYGKERQALEAIYQAFYEDARYIGEASILAELLGNVGVPEQSARDYLESGEDVETIFALTERYRVDPGVTGMPFHTVDGEPVALSTQSDWETLFEQARIAA